MIEVCATAHETLFELAGLTRGERVLIHAAGSAVGTAAVQMAKHAGAEVVATAGSPRKLAGARKLGADYAFNYKEQDFAEEIQRLSPAGVDVIEDFVGASYFQRHLTILRQLGRLVTVGLLGPAPAEIDPSPILYKRLKVLGFTLRPQSIAEKAAIVRRFETIWLPTLIAGAVRPTVHATLPFEQVREAHRILDASENFGKVVMTVT